MELVDGQGMREQGFSSRALTIKQISPTCGIKVITNFSYLIEYIPNIYVVAPDITQQAVSGELIANHLYGPSYVSFESALSFHEMIPERTYIKKSATTKRKIELTNIEMVKADVRPFIKNPEELAIWSTGYFMQLVDMIQFEEQN